MSSSSWCSTWLVVVAVDVDPAEGLEDGYRNACCFSTKSANSLRAWLTEGSVVGLRLIDLTGTLETGDLITWSPDGGNP